MSNGSRVTSKYMNYSYRWEDHTTWNISYTVYSNEKDTIHRIDFYLILTLGPRNGLRYYVVLQGGNHNNSY